MGATLNSIYMNKPPRAIWTAAAPEEYLQYSKSEGFHAYLRCRDSLVTDTHTDKITIYGWIRVGMDGLWMG